MILEAQFGSNITPITKPRLVSGKQFKPMKSESNANGIKHEPSDDETDEDELAEREEAELERLYGVGIPVPGVEIRVDKFVARVWLEMLDVECASTVFGARVKAVVDRAAETVAPLWSGEQQRRKH